MSPVTDVFSEEAIATLRARIGSPVPHAQQFNEIATRDAIRHFAHGYGDTNPLWSDQDYAPKTRHGGIIAPPTFPYSCEGIGQGAAAMGLRGAHSLWTGDEWEWFLPVRVNDRITFEEKLFDLREVQGKFASRLFEQISEKTFKTSSGQVVARCLMSCRRFTRYAQTEQGEKRDKYQEVTRTKYSRDELDKIFADYDKEEIRGANPRYWEDVQEGDELRHVVKGPLTVTDVIAWYIGMGPSPFIRAHGIRLAYDRRHPAAAIPNSMGIPDVPMRVHWEDEMARTIGVPAAFDMGNQRITWISQVLTNWMGDDGFLKRLKVELRRPNMIGDTCWCRGKVARKYVEDEQHLVECKLWADNQRGEGSAVATAIVILPTRARP